MGAGACCAASEPNTKAHIIKVIGKKVQPATMQKHYVRGDNVEEIEEPEALKAFFDEIAHGEKWDAKTKKEFKDKLWPAPVLEIKMEPVGLPSLDDMFSAVAAPLNTICQFRTDLDDAYDATKQACRILSKGKKVVNLKSALQVLNAALDGQLMIDVSIDPLNVDITVGKCEGDILNAVKALQKLSKAIVSIITGLPPLADEIQQVVQKAETLKDSVQGEASSMGLNPLEVAKAVRAAATNMNRISKFPQVIADLKNLGERIISDLRSMKS